MGKIVITTNVSLDGVVQDPDGQEDSGLGSWLTEFGGKDLPLGTPCSSPQPAARSPRIGAMRGRGQGGGRRVMGAGTGGEAQASSIGGTLMLLLPWKLPPLCLPEAAMATSVPHRGCCVSGSYSLGEAPMLLADRDQCRRQLRAGRQAGLSW